MCLIETAETFFHLDKFLGINTLKLILKKLLIQFIF